MAFHSKAVHALIFCAAVLISASSPAQVPRSKSNPTPPPASPTPPDQQDLDVVKINTNLVQIDVIATDSRGRQVNDLKADDFEIVEEGRTVPPVFFAYIPLGSLVTDKSVVGYPSARDLRRVFVFVVSNPVIEVGFSDPGARGGGAPRSGTFSTQANAARSADSARSLLTWFVDTQMGDLDLAAIADTDVDLGVLASFTNDRDVLRAAIKQVHESAGRSPRIRVMMVGGDLSLQPLVRQNLRMIETLENVISQVEKLPGRKVVTFVARGMLYNPALPYSEVIRDRVRKLIDSANRAQISIYTVQTRDLNPNGGNFGNDGLINLARETGGRAIYNTNDLRVGFATVIEENRGYYLLAYNPGADVSARPHRLQVRVKRRGVNVLMRSEAFTPSAIARGADAAANAVNLPLAATEVKMTMSPTLVTIGRASRIVTSWNIDLADVKSRPQTGGAQAFSLTLSIRVVGPDGHLLKQADREIAFDSNDAEFVSARRDGLISKFEIEAVQPGFYRVSVAVRDNFSGRVGTATRFVEARKPSSSK
jgi:VWFA-related protein